MSLEVLREGHRKALQAVDGLAQSGELLKLGDTAGAVTLIHQMLPILEEQQRVHFRQEEEGLFLFLAQVIGEGPIQAMVVEHESYWKSMGILKRLLEESGDASDLQRVLRHIIYLLQGHISREETAYFQSAEMRLSPAQLKAVDEEIEAITQL